MPLLEIPVPADEYDLQTELDALVKRNVRWLRRHPRTPSLYASGVRYQREPGTERWKGIAEVLSDGFGDCEDLGGWKAAELIVRGVDARARIRRMSPRLFHVFVTVAGSRVKIDPSRRLGMKVSA